MKHPSKMALAVVQKYVRVLEINTSNDDDPDSQPWQVNIGECNGNYTVTECFRTEHQANKAALHVIYPLAHAIDALIAKVKENQNV